MTIKEMAEKTLRDRWLPISRARSIERMDMIEESSHCLFCVEIASCSQCPLHTPETFCCNNHFSFWCNAIVAGNLSKARKEAEIIVKMIETVRDSN